MNLLAPIFVRARLLDLPIRFMAARDSEADINGCTSTGSGHGWGCGVGFSSGGGFGFGDILPPATLRTHAFPTYPHSRNDGDIF